MQIWTLWDQLLQDLRYALRITAANPAFAALATLSLALGIGANTAIYSFMDAVLMRALPVADPESLVVFNWHSKAWPEVAHSFNGSNYTDPKVGFASGNFPYPAYEQFRANNPVFSSIFAFTGAGRLNLLIRGQADLVDGQYVSGEYFSGLSVPPAAGRLIDPTDDRAGAPAVAVLSYGYAQRRFGESPKAVGQTVLVNNTPFTVIGVAAPSFYGVDPSGEKSIFVPMQSGALLEPASISTDAKSKYLDSNFFWVEAMGRLRPGVSLSQAQAAMAPVFQRFEAASAATDKERADLPALLLQPGANGLDVLRRRFSQPLYILMAMAGLILAIACANIANLLLARATARRREMAVRLSLGAGRLRVIRQLLTESVLLASIGGVLGILFANWGIKALELLITDGQNISFHANLNWHVLAVTILLSFATGLIFGLAPAIQATSIDLTPALKQSRAGAPGSRLHGSFLRVSLSQVLIVSQIAISLLLMIAAGLFVRTLSNLHNIELGFNRENVLLFSVNARQAGYKGEPLARFYDTLQTRLSGIPGVRHASLSNYALVSGAMSSTTLTIPGLVSQGIKVTSTLTVGPGFFTTMQIPLLLGREIDARDQPGAPKVAVVNELFAKTYFPNESPIGRHFGLGRGDKAPEIEIIGVAKNALYNSLKQDIRPTAYIPYGQNLQGLYSMTYELRTVGDPLAIASSAREIVRQADERIPLAKIVSQSHQVDQTITQERTFATLCTAFAVLAMLIACVGLYGTMAYNVARRTSEIGIRMALGAESPRVIWMVLREVLALAAVGLAIGLPAAYAATRFVKSFLFGMKPTDPLSLLLPPAILLAAAIFAGYGPARRAARIDPMVALRQD